MATRGDIWRFGGTDGREGDRLDGVWMKEARGGILTSSTCLEFKLKALDCTDNKFKNINTLVVN